MWTNGPSGCLAFQFVCSSQGHARKGKRRAILGRDATTRRCKISEKDSRKNNHLLFLVVDHSSSRSGEGDGDGKENQEEGLMQDGSRIEARY